MKDITSHFRSIPGISLALLATLVLSAEPLIAQDDVAPTTTEPTEAVKAEETPAVPATPPTPEADSPIAAPAATVPTPTTSEAKADAVNPKTERIQVVGSRIKRTQVETSSATTVITHEEIQRSGVSNLGELIRNSSSQTTGNFGGTSSYVRSGAQTASLFSLGAGRSWS